jgi:membrane associated rhomboid family serine protease
MFIPIGDENPSERTPYVNYGLIVANVLAFLLFCLGPLDDPGFIRWTIVPADLHWPTLFTSLFLHAGWMHLIGNMVFLWIFGDNVEDKLGHFGYLIFYLVCGLGADAAHILSNPDSPLSTLGASGAISGVMGAYIIYFPRHHVKTFIWLGIFYADVVRIPAFVWIGIWVAQQVLLNAVDRGAGGVAYLAHIGGFVAGAAIAAVTRALADHWPSSSRPMDRQDTRDPGARRLFSTVEADSGIDYLDQGEDRYAVMRLVDDPRHVGPIIRVVGSVTGETPFDVTHRLETTRGMVVREVPREVALRIQSELHTLGIPSAIILHNRSNFPPERTEAQGASWDNRVMRIRTADQIVVVPWNAPFLYVAGRTQGRAFIDVFLNRRSAFRIDDARSVPLTAVDPATRTEVSSDLVGFARAIRQRPGSAAANEGISVVAEGGDWRWLDFRERSDYDDYLFWLYNLVLAQGIQP